MCFACNRKHIVYKNYCLLTSAVTCSGECVQYTSLASTESSCGSTTRRQMAHTITLGINASQFSVVCVHFGDFWLHLTAFYLKLFFSFQKFKFYSRFPLYCIARTTLKRCKSMKLIFKRNHLIASIFSSDSFNFVCISI